MSEPRSFLCIHPHGEMYGSDRTFLQAVEGLRARCPDAQITAIVPIDGLLASRLRSVAEVRVEPMFALRRAQLARLPALLVRLTSSVLAARRLMNRYDVTYINTIVALDYILASRLARSPAVIHVHELPNGVTRTAFSAILRAARAQFVFISHAVREAFPNLPERRGTVVWNGTATRDAIANNRRGGTLNVLLIGRFNRWKGHGLLLEALSQLPIDVRMRLRVRFVGSAFRGQEAIAHDIAQMIEEKGLKDIVEMCHFDPDPSPHYAWSNVVVVPSTKPEPFGLVAIEAMAAGRAVIAAGHGGLTEIVEDGRTGMVFAPNDPAALAEAIRRYAMDERDAVQEGAAAHGRFLAFFREDRYKDAIATVIDTAH